MLVSLDLRHADALEAFLCEFDANPEELHGYFCGRDWPIERVVKTLTESSKGKGIQEGWVPCSTWFWEEQGALQGVINVRHRLTPGLRKVGGHIGYAVAPTHRRLGVATRMLAAVLPHCRQLGIKSALLTCDSDNPGSLKTIEANGGRLEKEAWYAPEKRTQRWYWISVDEQQP